MPTEEDIKKQSGEGRVITSLTCTDGTWGVVYSKSRLIQEVVTVDSSDFDARREQFNNRAARGFAITDFALNQGKLVMVFTKDERIMNQWFGTHAPQINGEEIVKQASEGLSLSRCVYAEGGYWLLLHKVPDRSHTQIIPRQDSFPSQSIQDMQKRGSVVTSVSCTKKFWTIGMAVDKGNPPQIIEGYDQLPRDVLHARWKQGYTVTCVVRQP